MADSLYGDIWFSDPDGETIGAAWTSAWLNVETVLDFAIFVAIENAGGNLVGEVYVEVTDDPTDASAVARAKLAWADNPDGDGIREGETIATGTDFEHIFDIIGCASPYVRVGVTYTSGASEALGMKAKIYRKRARSR